MNNPDAGPRFHFMDTGDSRFLPADDPLRGRASAEAESDVVIVVGRGVAQFAPSLARWRHKTAVLLELHTECLGVYTGESRGTEGSNVLGFARHQLGSAPPSPLVEVVRQPATSKASIDAARRVFAHMGLTVAVCGDVAGRIVDRFVRPYYNAALTALDEGLASADDLDKTLRLGLGYPEGPIALLERTGLAHHYDVTRALFDALGQQPYVPARRAAVAKAGERD